MARERVSGISNFTAFSDI